MARISNESLEQLSGEKLVGENLSENEKRIHVHIEPSKGWVSLRLKELWNYRELFYFFVWRDIKIRYKQTVLGASWAVIQPLMTMVIFSLFFGRLANIPSDGMPYPIFSYAGLVPWTFFANGLLQSSNSLVNNSNMLKKIYFPRLILPISSVSRRRWSCSVAAAATARARSRTAHSMRSRRVSSCSTWRPGKTARL